MALIPKFHILAAHYPVQAGQEIVAGMWVKPDSATGEVIIANGASGKICIGVAGDTKSVSVSGLPATNDATLAGADGVAPFVTPAPTRAFVNRVSDSYDETKASGRMTVYQAGGVFTSNEYKTGDSPTVNAPLYVNSDGKATVTPSASGQIVGYCTKALAAEDSGVPGTDVNGSMSLGNYFEFKMVV